MIWGDGRGGTSRVLALAPLSADEEINFQMMDLALPT